MCEALDDHEGSVNIGGRVTNFRFTDDIVVNAEDADRSRQDKSDDKQPKWLPKRDQDERSAARRSGKLQEPWDNHL